MYFKNIFYVLLPSVCECPFETAGAYMGLGGATVLRPLSEPVQRGYDGLFSPIIFSSDCQAFSNRRPLVRDANLAAESFQMATTPSLAWALPPAFLAAN